MSTDSERREELRRLREQSRRHERSLADVRPLEGDGPRVGAFADDDPKLHRRFASGEFDEELIGSFVDDERDRTPLEREILVSGLDDYLGLWDLFFIARYAPEGASGDDVADTVYAMVERFLGDGLLRSGMPTEGGGFEPDGASAEEVLGRVRELREELGRDPILGEGPWFDLTPAGERLAARVSRERGG